MNSFTFKRMITNRTFLDDSLNGTYNFSGSKSGVSSFVQIQLPFSKFDTILIKFKFCLLNTWDQISLMLFLGNDQHSVKTDHLALTYVQGYLMLTWSVGNGNLLICGYR